FKLSNRQYCPARTSHRYRPSSTNRVSRSASFRCSQARISSILAITNWARLRLSFGNIGGSLVIKLVKPTKVFSRSPDHGFLRQFLTPQAEANVRTTGAGILRKADATVGHKLT